MRQDQVVSAIRSNRSLSTLHPVAEVYSRPDAAVQAHGTGTIDVRPAVSAGDAAEDKAVRRCKIAVSRENMAHKCFGERLCIDSYTEW